MCVCVRVCVCVCVCVNLVWSARVACAFCRFGLQVNASVCLDTRTCFMKCFTTALPNSTLGFIISPARSCSAYSNTMYTEPFCLLWSVRIGRASVSSTTHAAAAVSPTPSAAAPPCLSLTPTSEASLLPCHVSALSSSSSDTHPARSS